MERKINRKIEDSFTVYKEEIKKGVIGTITSINTSINEIPKSSLSVEKVKEITNSELMNLLQELFDYQILQLEKLDFQKRKRVKNIVPLHDRCIAMRANNEQCTRRRKGDCQFCGTHSKGTPHGIICQNIDNEENDKVSKKISVWAQDIKGIIYYIDDNFNVYDTSAVISGLDNPKIIAKYNKILDDGGNTKFEIPEFNI